MTEQQSQASCLAGQRLNIYLWEVPNIALGINILFQFLQRLFFTRSNADESTSSELQRLVTFGDFVENGPYGILSVHVVEYFVLFQSWVSNKMWSLDCHSLRWEDVPPTLRNPDSTSPWRPSKCFLEWSVSSFQKTTETHSRSDFKSLLKSTWRIWQNDKELEHSSRWRSHVSHSCCCWETSRVLREGLDLEMRCLRIGVHESGCNSSDGTNVQRHVSLSAWRLYWVRWQWGEGGVNWWIDW